MTHKRRPIFGPRRPWPRIFLYTVLVAWLIIAASLYVMYPFRDSTVPIVWGGLGTAVLIAAYRLVAALLDID